MDSSCAPILRSAPLTSQAPICYSPGMAKKTWRQVRGFVNRARAAAQTLGRKGGAARWRGVSRRDRVLAMRRVRLVGLANARAQDTRRVKITHLT